MEKQALETIWMNNLYTYAEVLLGRCEAQAVGKMEGQWITIQLRIIGDSKELKIRRRKYYDVDSLDELIHHWGLWREEAGLTEYSLIPQVISPNIPELEIRLELQPGLDFFDRARMLLDPLSPVHCRTPLLVAA